MIDRLELELHNTENRNTELQRKIKADILQISDLQKETEILQEKYNQQSRELTNLRIKSNEYQGVKTVFEEKVSMVKKLQADLNGKEKEYSELFQNYCKILKENERLYIDNVQATKGIRHMR